MKGVLIATLITGIVLVSLAVVFVNVRLGGLLQEVSR